MVILRWSLLILIVSICSIVHVNCEESPPVRPVERSPTPNMDDYDVQLSLKKGWFDTIDGWFRDTITKGKDLVDQIAKTGEAAVGHVIDLVPTPKGIFQASKDVLLGLPQEAVIFAIDTFCTYEHCIC